MKSVKSIFAVAGLALIGTLQASLALAIPSSRPALGRPATPPATPNVPVPPSPPPGVCFRQRAAGEPIRGIDIILEDRPGGNLTRIRVQVDDLLPEHASSNPTLRNRPPRTISIIGVEPVPLTTTNLTPTNTAINEPRYTSTC